MVKVGKTEQSAKHILQRLPNKGWGVLEIHVTTMYWLVLEGYVKAQYTYIPNVFQARLTGKGRKLLK